MRFITAERDDYTGPPANSTIFGNLTNVFPPAGRCVGALHVRINAASMRSDACRSKEIVFDRALRNEGELNIENSA